MRDHVNAPTLGRTLLAQGRALIDALGADTGDASTQGVHLLERAGEGARALLEIHDGILPLMQRLGQPQRGPRWWQRFTGESMERDLLAQQLHDQLDDLAAHGEATLDTLLRHAQALADHDEVMASELQTRQRDLEVGRWLLAPEQADACRQAGLDGHDMERLARRVANLASMQAATELTRRQYRLARQHADVAADRYREVRTLVLPMLRQTGGFKRFNGLVTMPRTEEDPI